MTFQEVRLALGLAPFASTANMRGVPRSGRTTYLLVDAVAAVSRGDRVAMLGLNGQKTLALVREVIRLCDAIGVSWFDLEAAESEGATAMIAARPRVVARWSAEDDGTGITFVDHSAWERLRRPSATPQPPRAS